MELYTTNLKCNGLRDPIGVSCDSSRLSWQIAGEGRNVLQRAYEIEISQTPDFEKTALWECIKGNGRQQMAYIRRQPEEKTEYYWRVRTEVESEEGLGWTGWSEPAFFETALIGAESWKGRWIEADEDFYAKADVLCKAFWKKNEELGPYSSMVGEPEDYPACDQGLRRSPYLQKYFTLDAVPKKARIYLTAHGFYELHVNDEKIGPCALAPDFTAYDKCIYYQTFDVTKELKCGENHLEIVLGDGWYAGHAQGIPGTNHLYGERPALILQLEAELADGSRMTVVSDDSFQAQTGPLLYADLFMGEYLDLNQTAETYGTVEREYSKEVLMAQKGEYIKVVHELGAVKVCQLPEGAWIVDFGQVFAGRELLHLKGKPGDLVKVERSEMLDPSRNGDIYPMNTIFPWHDQTNYFHLNQSGIAHVCPHFSFQGFRYLKISGLNGELTAGDCRAEVISTAMEPRSSFRCSDERLNRLTENARWSQCSNMLSIPTDCPQRERGGFTGDAQVFATTASWHSDVSGFFGRWLEQCRLEQLKRGQIPIVVPYTKAYMEHEFNPGWTSAGWGDAIIFIPWDMYQAYGDIQFLKDNYDAMERWMDYVAACAEETMPERCYADRLGKHDHQKYLWNTGFHWGDWLMPGMDAYEGRESTKEITASLFYYRQASVMAKACKALEKQERKNHYEDLQDKIRAAFHQEYIKEGRLTCEYQGLYVMAIAFGIVEGTEREIFAKRLDELVIENEYHLQTGFLSTPFLLDVLWETGYQETAYQVLYQDTPPSWLYEVNMGATAIWENWDLQKEDGTITGTSCNHYAFGAVCDFIYRRIGGIRAASGGFSDIVIEAEAIEGLDFAELAYETNSGACQIKWVKKKAGISYEIQIPHNVTVVVKGNEEEQILGSGSYCLFYTFRKKNSSIG